MLEVLWLIFVSFTVGLSGAIVPGPVFLVTVSETLRKGKVAGPLIVVGHLLLEALIMSAILKGVGATLGSSDAQIMIGYVGGSALISMGLILLKNAFKININLDLQSKSKNKLTSHGLIATGILSSGSNPQFYLWWLTIGLSTMNYCISITGIYGLAAFIIGHAFSDLIWFGLVSYSVEKGKRILNPKAIRIIIFGSAIFLVFFGATFIYQASITLS